MAAFPLPPLPPALPCVLFRFPTSGVPHRSNSGRGGGIRTPIPGFGDRSPNRWTTPLNRLPFAIHPEAALFAAEGFAPSASFSFFSRLQPFSSRSRLRASFRLGNSSHQTNSTGLQINRNYFTSLCSVCLRHARQNFLVSMRSECFFLFF